MPQEGEKKRRDKDVGVEEGHPCSPQSYLSKGFAQQLRDNHIQFVSNTLNKCSGSQTAIIALCHCPITTLALCTSLTPKSSTHVLS